MSPETGAAVALRQKRWTTRARTGCQTCRTRHVKCDETRPICRKCSIKGRDCHYALEAAPVKMVSDPSKPPQLLTEPESPDWDFMQAVQYFYTIIRPHRSVEFGPLRDPPFHTPGDWCVGFVCGTVCHRIECVSKVRGRLLRMGEDPALGRLWKTYWRYMGKQLTIINKIVNEGAQEKYKAIMPLMQLMRFDLVAKGLPWQQHMTGLFAYMDSIGGIDFILGLPDPPIIVCSALQRAITCNTTSPGRGQMLGYDHYTDEQLRKVLELDLLSDMPCPIELFITLAHITRLRQRVACGLVTTASALSIPVREIFTVLDDFDPWSWARKNTVVSKDIAPIVARIFLAAVRLYAVVSLPRAAVLAAHSPRTSYQSLRVRQRDALIELIKEGLTLVQFTTSLDWPVVVAGVAAGTPHPRKGSSELDEDYKDALAAQDFVHHWIYSGWMGPASTSIYLALLQKLRAFWEAGDTEWDDCFWEPTPC